jgi:hypothetical protein
MMCSSAEKEQRNKIKVYRTVIIKTDSVEVKCLQLYVKIKENMSLQFLKPC